MTKYFQWEFPLVSNLPSAPTAGCGLLRNQLPTPRLGQICPTACGFGILASCLTRNCDVSIGRTMGSSVLALASYTLEGHSQEAMTK